MTDERLREIEERWANRKPAPGVPDADGTDVWTLLAEVAALQTLLRTSREVRERFNEWQDECPMCAYPIIGEHDPLCDWPPFASAIDALSLEGVAK